MIGSCSYIWFDRHSEMHRFEKAASLVNLEQALYIIIFLGGGVCVGWIIHLMKVKERFLCTLFCMREKIVMMNNVWS